MNEPLVLEFKDVIKHGTRAQIGPLNLQIPANYVVAIVGPNGAGKSTILQMMMRCILPSAGEISWFGLPAGQLPIEARGQISYISELPCLEEDYSTGTEAAHFRSQFYPSWDHERFQALVQKFAVPMTQRLNKVSKGERRKFEIACALAVHPKLLIMDEPTSGLDPFIWKDLLDELRIVMEQEELTIILSTHIIEEVRRLADYIVLVSQGQALGMVEKDMLYGSWQQVWLKGVSAEEIHQAGVMFYEEEGAMIQKVTIRESELESLLDKLEDAHIVKQQSLEIEEILKLWIQGHRI